MKGELEKRWLSGNISIHLCSTTVNTKHAHSYRMDVPDLNGHIRHCAASGSLEHAVSISTGGDSECWITLVGGVGCQVLPQRQGLFELRSSHSASSVGDCIT